VPHAGAVEHPGSTPSGCSLSFDPQAAIETNADSIASERHSFIT
jgi:hypothetical protein